MGKTADYHEFLIGTLRKDEAFREAYLNEALNESDGRVSLIMFRNVAEALGGMTQLAKRSGLNRQNLYKVLSGEKDPSYSTVEGIVHGLGFRIKVESAKKHVRERLVAAHEKPAPYKVKKSATSVLKR